MPTIKVDEKIVGYGVVKDAPEPAQAGNANAQPEAQAGQPGAQAGNRVRTSVRARNGDQKVIRMHEKLERPEKLVGSTYKVKTPVSDHAMYVTINDIILNEGTEFEKRRPFEIFINSKNLDHYQWIVALTRIMSAVFRKGGDVAFLVEELKAVFDPRGGYWQPGGKFMPSIIAELGHIVERHLTDIGLIGPSGPSDEQREELERKRAEFRAQSSQQDAFAENSFPDGAQLCAKCNTAASVMLDGCLTCLNCGYSKCG